MEQRRDGRGRDPRPRHPLEPDPAAASLSRRRGRAPDRLDRGEPARRRRIPTRPISPAMSRRPSARSAPRDGTELHYRMLSPPREPGRRYPVFVQVYGGPGAGRQATRAWAQPAPAISGPAGWIVFSLDNRGSPDRGKAFENAHLPRDGQGRGRRTSSPASPGCAARTMSIRGRVAVYGWSYGGYMVLRLLEAAPGTFAAGVAGAPVTRWELYDTHYTERYLGNPAHRSRALSGVRRDPQCRPHRRSAAAGPRHGRRQCRVREFDGADGRAPGRGAARSR